MRSGDLCGSNADIRASVHCLFTFNKSLNDMTFSYQIPRHQIVQKSLTTILELYVYRLLDIILFGPLQEFKCTYLYLVGEVRVKICDG